MYAGHIQSSSDEKPSLAARLKENGLFVTADDWRANADGATARVRDTTANPLQPPTGSIQEWWNETLRWKDGVAPPNPFAPGADASG